MAKSNARITAPKGSASLFKKPNKLEILVHEVKTPIIGIYYHLEELKKTKDPKQKNVHLNTISKTCTSLLNWLNQINASKPDYFNFKPQPKNFVLKDCIQEVMDNLYPYAKNKKLILQLNDLDPNLQKKVCGYPTLLQELLYNLLHNSIKYSNSGTITLSIKLADNSKANQTITFEMTDQGIGFTQKALKSIFLPYSQSDKRNEGRGIGLYIVKRLCNLLKAEIDFKSKRNVGTTFTLHIPFAKKDTLTSKTSPKKNRLVKTKGHTFKKILIVEDSTIQQTYLIKLLSKISTKVEIHAVTQKDLKQHDLSNYDLLFLDLHSKEYSPKRLINHIIKHVATEKIIITTANYDKKSLLELEKLGFNQYLPKPITLEGILDVFNTISAALPFESNLIDWELSLIRANHNKNLAKDLLGQFIKQLPQVSKKIQRAYQNKSYSSLSSIIHYLKGSVYYVGIPKLENILNGYEKALSTAKKQTLSKLHKNLLDTIEQLLSDANLSKPLKIALK